MEGGAYDWRERKRRGYVQTLSRRTPPPPFSSSSSQREWLRCICRFSEGGKGGREGSLGPDHVLICGAEDRQKREREGEIQVERERHRERGEHSCTHTYTDIFGKCGIPHTVPVGTNDNDVRWSESRRRTWVSDASLPFSRMCQCVCREIATKKASAQNNRSRSLSTTPQKKAEEEEIPISEREKIRLPPFFIAFSSYPPK